MDPLKGSESANSRAYTVVRNLNDMKSMQATLQPHTTVHVPTGTVVHKEITIRLQSASPIRYGIMAIDRPAANEFYTRKAVNILRFPVTSVKL